MKELKGKYSDNKSKYIKYNQIREELSKETIRKQFYEKIGAVAYNAKVPVHEFKTAYITFLETNFMDYKQKVRDIVKELKKKDILPENKMKSAHWYETGYNKALKDLLNKLEGHND